MSTVVKTAGSALPSKKNVVFYGLCIVGLCVTVIAAGGFFSLITEAFFSDLYYILTGNINPYVLSFAFVLLIVFFCNALFNRRLSTKRCVIISSLSAIVLLIWQYRQFMSTHSIYEITVLRNQELISSRAIYIVSTLVFEIIVALASIYICKRIRNSGQAVTQLPTVVEKTDNSLPSKKNVVFYGLCIAGFCVTIILTICYFTTTSTFFVRGLYYFLVDNINPYVMSFAFVLLIAFFGNALFNRRRSTKRCIIISSISAILLLEWQWNNFFAIQTLEDMSDKVIVNGQIIFCISTFVFGVIVALASIYICKRIRNKQA